MIAPNNTTTAPTLREYALSYVSLRDGSPGYRRQLLWCVGFLEQWLGRELAISQLSDVLIRDYVFAHRGRLAPRTLRNRRNMLLRLLNHACDDETLAVRPNPPRRSTRPAIRVAAANISTWTIGEVRHLLATAESLTREYPGHMLASRYWSSWIRAAWDSGLRGCDLRSLERHWINERGILTIRQQKTGKNHYAAFRPSTLAAIDRLWNESRRFVWPLFCSLSEWRKEAADLVKAAGLTGSIGMLRHSAGTAVELQHPGHGPLFLGNTPDVFYAHYFDRSRAVGQTMPEEL